MIREINHDIFFLQQPSQRATAQDKTACARFVGYVTSKSGKMCWISCEYDWCSKANHRYSNAIRSSRDV